MGRDRYRLLQLFAFTITRLFVSFPIHMKTIALIAAVLCLSTSLLFAAEGDRVSRIDVIGNERIDKGVVTNAIKTKEGDVYDPAKIGDDLKSVFKTGFFSDVVVDTKESEKGKIITFVVVERPPVNAVQVTGNKKVKTEDIRDKVKVRTGSVLNLERVRETLEEIRKLYATKGYYGAKVDYEIDTEGSRTTVVFNIEEPQRAFVRKVTFVGNRHLKSGQLKGVMKTQEKGWFSWFTGSGILDEEVIDEDRKQVEALYAENGYIKAKIGRPDVNVSKDGKSIAITMQVEEGSLYKISNVAFSGDVIFDQAKMKQDLKSRTGQTFRSSFYRADLATLTDLYQDKGFAFVDVAPLTQTNDEEKTVDLVFDVDKGSQVYFNRINIVGNIKTRDKVVRRELRVAEGDIFSGSKLKESKRRLTNTTYFKTVDLKTTKTEEPDQINMDVLVEEKPTGTLSLGVGYSSYEKVLVTGSVSQENIFGTGKKIYLDASLSSITHLYNLTLVDPYIFDKDLSAALNVFNTQRIFSTYDYGGYGGSFSLTRPLTDYVSTTAKYRFESTSVTNIDASAGPFIQNQAGTKKTSSVTLALSKNSVDDVLNPSKGTVSSISVEVAGGPFLGDNDFIKSIATYGRYFPYKGGTAFFARGTAGTVRPYNGKTVPVYERFFVGGINTVRGFKYGEAGPLDSATEDVIGALNELVFNFEWIFPIYQPAGLKGVLFVDYGKGFDESDGFFRSLRPTAGVGIRWMSPLGPIRLELGFNLNRKSGERGSVFDFTMGRAF
jgi:outer membrane protein insertion porin family